MTTQHTQRLLFAALLVALWGGATACGKDDGSGGTRGQRLRRLNPPPRRRHRPPRLRPPPEPCWRSRLLHR